MNQEAGVEDQDVPDVPPGDYQLGFQARLVEDPYDVQQTVDWQRGWNAAELALELKPDYLRRKN